MENFFLFYKRLFIEITFLREIHFLVITVYKFLELSSFIFEFHLV